MNRYVTIGAVLGCLLAYLLLSHSSRPPPLVIAPQRIAPRTFSLKDLNEMQPLSVDVVKGRLPVGWKDGGGGL